MDTRKKILKAIHVRGRVAPDAKLHAVVGYFDPLMAAHGQLLEKAAADAIVVAVVTEPPEPLLLIKARTELVAGLAAVRWVVPAKDGPEKALALLKPDQVTYIEKEDQQRTRQLVQRVQERHRR